MKIENLYHLSQDDYKVSMFHNDAWDDPFHKDVQGIWPDSWSITCNEFWLFCFVFGPWPVPLQEDGQVQWPESRSLACYDSGRFDLPVGQLSFSKHLVFDIKVHYVRKRSVVIIICELFYNLPEWTKRNNHSEWNVSARSWFGVERFWNRKTYLDRILCLCHLINRHQSTV
jgi:hypothetical protein